VIGILLYHLLVLFILAFCVFEVVVVVLEVLFVGDPSQIIGLRRARQ